MPERASGKQLGTALAHAQQLETSHVDDLKSGRCEHWGVNRTRSSDVSSVVVSNLM